MYALSLVSYFETILAKWDLLYTLGFNLDGSYLSGLKKDWCKLQTHNPNL